MKHLAVDPRASSRASRSTLCQPRDKGTEMILFIVIVVAWIVGLGFFVSQLNSD